MVVAERLAVGGSCGTGVPAVAGVTRRTTAAAAGAR
jgi:hypothetical protein